MPAALMWLLNLIGLAGTAGYVGTSIFGSYGEREGLKQAEKQSDLNRQVAALSARSSMQRLERAEARTDQENARADRQAYLDRDLATRLSRDQNLSGLLGMLQNSGIQGAPEAMAAGGDQAAQIRRELAMQQMQSSNDPFLRMFGG